MGNLLQITLPTAIVRFLPSESSKRIQRCEAIYAANRDRVYSFAFWMTDSEEMAETLSEQTFLRAFGMRREPDPETIDRALVRELRRLDSVQLGEVKLRCAVVREVGNIRRNTKRVELERAIVQLPHTERMIFCMHDGDGYDHKRIARTLGISEGESQRGLHQARLRIRELVSGSVSQAAA